ncbi:MAG: deoxyribodipyrimidine photo-lyase, partial [Aquificaceae bacterium]
MRAVYLFKRDLRLEDNKGLAYASRRHKDILPLFIFDKEILKDLRAEDERLGYVVRALEELSKRIRVYCLYDTTEEALRKVFKVYKPTHLYTTKSYSWTGKERNLSIKNLCEDYGVEYVEIFENFLVKPEDVPTRRVFTPFYGEWIKRVILEE